MIQAGAESAVKRAFAGALQPYNEISGPYEFEVELRQPMGEAMLENLTSLDEFEIVSAQLVRVSAPDMDLGFRRVAYLGYANSAGVTRH